jgi:ribosomal protein S18 acetylase RimI-like enzyme
MEGADAMSDLRIQNAEPSDAPVLAGLIAGFRDHLKARSPSDAEIRVHLPRALHDPTIEFACAWLSGEAVGYTQTRFLTSVWAPGIEAFLEDLFVVIPARGRWVGRSLLRHTLARAEARGALRFSLNTNDHNEGAHSLYRSEGLLPQSHALYPGGREVLWSRRLGAA